MLAVNHTASSETQPASAEDICMSNKLEPIDETFDLRQAFIDAFGIDIGEDIEIAYKGRMKEIHAGDDVSIFVFPGLKAEATNLDTGEEFSFNATGAQHQTIVRDEDGNIQEIEYRLTGHNSVFTLDENGDPTFLLLKGNYTLSFNPDGSPRDPLEGHGNMTDLLDIL